MRWEAAALYSTPLCRACAPCAALLLSPLSLEKSRSPIHHTPIHPPSYNPVRPDGVAYVAACACWSCPGVPLAPLAGWYTAALARCPAASCVASRLYTVSNHKMITPLCRLPICVMLAKLKQVKKVLSLVVYVNPYKSTLDISCNVPSTLDLTSALLLRF